MGLQSVWSLFLCFLTFGQVGCEGTVPDNLGVTAGQLAPCPSSPNCVSSQADPTDAEHFMQPIGFDGPAEEAQARLRAVLAGLARTTVVEEAPGYLRAEARSARMGFVDDVEFVIDGASGLIHFRSAARLGYDDLNVNRQRMETVTAQFQQAAQPQ